MAVLVANGNEDLALNPSDAIFLRQRRAHRPPKSPDLFGSLFQGHQREQLLGTLDAA